MHEEGHDDANAALFSRAYKNLQGSLTFDQGTLVILNLVVGEAGGGGVGGECGTLCVLL